MIQYVLQGKATVTLRIALDHTKIAHQVQAALQQSVSSHTRREKQEDIVSYKTADEQEVAMEKLLISSGQVIYMTPQPVAAKPHHHDKPIEATEFRLSHILDDLSKMHIFIQYTQGHEPALRIKAAVHQSILEQPYCSTIPEGQWFDMIFPEDTNIMLGLCRGEDSSFASI
jgi:hypothetical protein